VNTFTIKTESFEGPLELLLSLIEKRKLFINDIALAQVTDDYIKYLEDHPETSISHNATFILVASTLLLIKSKSLLPTLDLTTEEQASVEDLERRLKLYQRYKELSRHIHDRFGKQVQYGREQASTTMTVFAPHKGITAAALVEACRRVLSQMPKVEKLPEVVVRTVVSLEEMIDRLTDRVQKAIRMSFREFSGAGGAGKGMAIPKEKRVDVIVSFLAMLELVKNGIIEAKQDDRFGEIEMESGQLGVPSY
jgi:segregation and condensation protein A